MKLRDSSLLFAARYYFPFTGFEAFLPATLKALRETLALITRKCLMRCLIAAISVLIGRVNGPRALYSNVHIQLASFSFSF